MHDTSMLIRAILMAARRFVKFFVHFFDLFNSEAELNFSVDKINNDANATGIRVELDIRY